MKLNIKRLRDMSGKAVPLEAEEELSTVEYKGRTLRLLDKLRVAGEAYYKAGAAHLSVNLSTRIERECSRCLKKLAVPIALTEVIELKEGEWDLSQESFAMKRGLEELELLPIFTDLIVTSLDPKPLCRDDCKGLCPECGQDLNEGECNCQDQGSPHFKDPRLAKLKEWLK